MSVVSDFNGLTLLSSALEFSRKWLIVGLWSVFQSVVDLGADVLRDFGAVLNFGLLLLELVLKVLLDFVPHRNTNIVNFDARD